MKKIWLIGMIILTVGLWSNSGFAVTTAEEYYRQGCDYCDQKSYGEAVKSFEKAVELEPNNATYHYNLGVCYYNLGKFEKAIPYLKKAIEVDDIEGKIRKAASELLKDKEIVDAIKRQDKLKFKEGYQNARWGMTIEEIKQSFPKKQWKIDEDIWYFEDKIFDNDAKVAFQFFNNELWRVILLLKQVPPLLGTKEEISNARSGFFTLLSALKKNYGEPLRVTTKASDNPFIDEELALQVGEGSYISIWETEESQIVLFLGGGGYTKPLGLRILYQSLYYKKLKEQSEIKEKL